MYVCVFVCVCVCVLCNNVIILKEKKARIHEDSNGNIYINGVTTRLVNSEEEVKSLHSGYTEYISLQNVL